MKNIGKGQSLIDGINFASGDIILFLDGDGHMILLKFQN